MPSALTYPGVYVEEIPSGVRTITGVATSIGAFVGRTRRGPVDEPIVITNYGDFERQFGGLWFASPMTYAVRDFFANGGAQAVIVRGYGPPPAPAAPPAGGAPAGGAGGTPAGGAPAGGAPAGGAPAAPAAPVVAADGIATIEADSAHAGGLPLVAVTPGEWANMLRTRIEDAAGTVAPPDPARPGKLFNLYVALVRHDSAGKVIDVAELEVFRNVSLYQSHARRVDNVLKAESKLVRAASSFAATTDAMAGPTASSPASGEDEWKTTASQGVGALGSDGIPLDRNALTGDASRGLYALDRTDQFNLLCLPPHRRRDDLVPAPTPSTPIDIESGLIDDAIAFCKRKRAMLLIDPPNGWNSRAAAVSGLNATPSTVGTASENAALFFPRVRRPDPARPTVSDDFAPCGVVAGVMARTDVERGVWKAPAGLAATLLGVPELSVKLTEGDIGLLNPLGVNCLRPMPNLGHVVWGSRTRLGSDALASEWKYLPVRRLTLFIEESLYRGTHWVVFEPNDEPLWSSIRLNVGAFMHTLFRQGAFQGQTARQAYEVKCDAETTTQDDINRGVVNIVVRFAPLKPAEFVVIKIQQLAGQVQA